MQNNIIGIAAILIGFLLIIIGTVKAPPTGVYFYIGIFLITFGGGYTFTKPKRPKK